MFLSPSKSNINNCGGKTTQNCPANAFVSVGSGHLGSSLAANPSDLIMETYIIVIYNVD